MPGWRNWAPWLVLTLLGVSPLSRGGEATQTADQRDSRYPHRSIRGQEVGSGPRSYWLFEPAEPRPAQAPVVVFLHGWLSINPGIYGAWIEHLTRSGHVVVAPRYQEGWTTPPADFLPNTVAAVRDALDVLETAPDRVRPDRDRFALIGHSAGGNLAAQLASVARSSGLPVPKALVSVMPGEVIPSTWPKLSEIPSEVRLAVVAAEEDVVVGDERARQIYQKTVAVPDDQKLFVLYRSDRRGAPALVADHLAPTAGLAWLDTGEGPFREFQMARATVNALDIDGLWRLADLTLHAGFADLDLPTVTQSGALLRDLGRWSDGRPVRSPLVAVGQKIDAFPRVVPVYGLRLVPWPSVPALSSADPARLFPKND
ncbi:alpha/beta hydrolase fold domain-containing protein [soil metagenome]